MVGNEQAEPLPLKRYFNWSCCLLDFGRQIAYIIYE